MGGSTSYLNIESRAWKKNKSHEIYTNVYDRNLSLVSYQPDEYLSFGKFNLDFLKNNFPNEFKIEEKGWNFYDGKRINYDTSIIEPCCLGYETYKIKDGGTRSCHVDTQTFNTNVCDHVLYDTCFVKRDYKKKCPAWIRNVVELRKPAYFNLVKDFASKESNRKHAYTQVFLESLRDYNNNVNNYNYMADNILNSYSNDVKFNEYKCAFPPTHILNAEQENNSTPKECWYKECVLSPAYKLKSENLYKNKLCNVQICDIKIENLNISNNEITIQCANKYNSKKIENFEEKIPYKIDQEELFFVPTFINTVIPFFIIFLFLFF